MSDEKVGYDGASRITGLSKATLYALVRSNQIPHYKLAKRATVFSVRELYLWLRHARNQDHRSSKKDVSQQQRGARGRWVKKHQQPLRHRVSSPTAITPPEPRGRLVMPNAEGQFECSCEDCQWAAAENARLRTQGVASSPLVLSSPPSPSVGASPNPSAMKSRGSWESYFMRIAHVVASRSTCPRKSVGAVLVRDHRIVAAGYNGSLRGQSHCIDVGCEVVDSHCRRVLHAESNAIMQAASFGIALRGTHAYVTVSPCVNCFKQLVSAGVRRVTYGKAYRDDGVVASLASACGVELVAAVCERCSERCGGACERDLDASLSEGLDAGKTSTTT